MANKNAPKKAEDSKYTRAELINYAKKAFGVSPEVVAGALSNSNKDEFTKNEVKSAIDKFLKRKVK